MIFEFVPICSHNLMHINKIFLQVNRACTAQHLILKNNRFNDVLKKPAPT